ncbi:hypothetical protein D3C84_894890 [compost metagenome]
MPVKHFVFAPQLRNILFGAGDIETGTALEVAPSRYFPGEQGKILNGLLASLIKLRCSPLSDLIRKLGHHDVIGKLNQAGIGGRASSRDVAPFDDRGPNAAACERMTAQYAGHAASDNDGIVLFLPCAERLIGGHDAECRWPVQRPGIQCFTCHSFDHSRSLLCPINVIQCRDSWHSND